MLKTTQVVTVLFVSIIGQSVNALRCYECNSVRNISDCTTVVQCSTDENCFTDLTGSGDNTRYTVGCRSKQVCRQPSTSSQGALIGRSVSTTMSCSQCCGVDLCNQNICSTAVQGLFTNKCEDDPNFNCAQVSSLFNVCADKDHAKLVCRKYCGLCDIVDGHWLEWTSWSTCSQTCDNGTIFRKRYCNRTEGGLYCNGEGSETLNCFIKACPVNGGWTTWTAWSSCSETCGAGIARRSRDCSNPPPGPDGKDCVGDVDDMQICMDTVCYDGTWLSWSTWSTCSASCQGGISKRTRQCNTTLTSLGHSCIGDDEELLVCNTQLCADSVIDGMWSLWSSWTACSVYCSSERTRTCTNPSPSRYGKNCLGNAKEAKDCNLEYCSHGVRLVNGSDPYEGRLEVFYKGKWGTVCDDDFNDHSALTLCRMMNYRGPSKAYNSSAYGEGTLPVLLALGDCAAGEYYTEYKSIFECSPLVMEPKFCTHANDVGVSCHPNDLKVILLRLNNVLIVTGVNVKLVNGTNKYNGKLMVSVAGENWHTICDPDFLDTEAKVVCKMLGFPSFMSVPFYTKSSRPSYVPWYTEYLYRCYGQEKSLSDCDADLYGHGCYSEQECGGEDEAMCYPDDEVGVACGNDFGIRLTNGTNKHNGRIEISIDGIRWSKVCDNYFTKKEIVVACKMLGLSSNVTVGFTSYRYGVGTALDTTYEFYCSGSERSLAQCTIDQNTGCSDDSSVGIDCSPSIDVRLVNGTSANTGRVEVSLDGSYWEGICDYNFGTEEANVICKTLGYTSHKAYAYKNAHFGKPNTQVMLSLECNGKENNIADCNIIGQQCYDTATSVVCSDSPVRARLSNGSGPHDGRLELSLDGTSWGSVCRNNFGEQSAKVACRMLGFPTDIVIVQYFAYSQNDLKPVVSSIKCNGTEDNLNACTIDTSELNSCTMSNGFATGIACLVNTTRQFRLVNGTSPNNGRLEMTYDGTAWGTVCTDWYDPKYAVVACRTLGLPSQHARLISTTPGKGSIFLEVIRCQGSEQNILDCQHRDFVISNCQHSRDLGILCS